VSVIVPRLVVDPVVVAVEVDVVAVVVEVEAVDVVVVVGAVVLELVVVVGGAVVVELVEVVVELSLPLSAATTASATPSPITAATRIPISAFMPPLMPPLGGSPPAYGSRRGGGTSIRRVGSSCIGAAV
jgi:hypothetical protein